MGESLATTLPLVAALETALRQRQPAVGLGHHSDRSVQYASTAYRQRLPQAGVIPSMIRRGNYYDNAAMESFWSSLKRERTHRCQFATRAAARADRGCNITSPCKRADFQRIVPDETTCRTFAGGNRK